MPNPEHLNKIIPQTARQNPENTYPGPIDSTNPVAGISNYDVFYHPDARGNGFRHVRAGGVYVYNKDRLAHNRYSTNTFQEKLHPDSVITNPVESTNNLIGEGRELQANLELENGDNAIISLHELMTVLYSEENSSSDDKPLKETFSEKQLSIAPFYDKSQHPKLQLIYAQEAGNSPDRSAYFILQELTGSIKINDLQGHLNNNVDIGSIINSNLEELDPAIAKKIYDLAIQGTTR